MKSNSFFPLVFLITMRIAANSILCILLVSTLMIRSASAQTSHFKIVKPGLYKGTKIRVYEIILTEFNKLFPSAENVIWLKKDKNFVGIFFIADQMHMVLLDPRGGLIHKITHGTENHLPIDIRKMVKDHYVGYLITTISLVEQENRRIWIIHLQNYSHYIIVRVENNEMEKVRKYKRSK